MRSPADSTVVVTLSPPAGVVFSSRMVDRVLEKAAQLSLHILLVKFVNDQIWLILDDGHMALAALSMDGAKLDDSTTINVKLKSEDWQLQFEKTFERLIIDDKLDPKFGEDFSTDRMGVKSHIVTNLSCNDLENIDFSVENESALSASNSSSILKVPPKRPPPPKTSPQALPDRIEQEVVRFGLEAETVIPTPVNDDDWSDFVADRQQQI
uniref:Synaptojanin-1/2 RNA recognition motif domain-containing protein n=1 Tax=Romanomermis culicivorax TaxID=13658 RepID=A0A915JWV6_ROMCU